MTTRQWRPSWSTYLAFSRTGLVVVGVIVLGGVVATAISPSAGLAVLPLEVVVVGAFVGAFGSQVLRIARTRVEVDAESLSWRGVFGRCRLRRADLRGVLAPIARPLQPLPPTTLLVTDGRQRVRLVAVLWAEADLVQIATELQLRSALLPISPSAVEEHAPGATTAIDRHPWRTGLVAAALILAVVTVLAVLPVLGVGTARDDGRGPAQVSPATVTDQDRVRADVEVASGRNGWRQPEVALWTCCGSNGSPAGWLRHVSVLDDQHASDASASVRRVQAALRRDGYTLSGPEHQDTTVLLDGSRPGGLDSESVQVQIDPGYASLELIGPCES